jgi:galactokinase
VMLARDGTGTAVARRIAERYATRSGQRPTILLPQPSGA